jgi:hypothetical protein
LCSIAKDSREAFLSECLPSSPEKRNPPTNLRSPPSLSPHQQNTHRSPHMRFAQQTLYSPPPSPLHQQKTVISTDADPKTKEPSFRTKAKRRRSCPCLFLSQSKTKTRHFDRSRSRFCDRRSGEIRFSTTSVSPPTPRFCLCLSPGQNRPDPAPIAHVAIAGNASQSSKICHSERSEEPPHLFFAVAFVRSPSHRLGNRHFDRGCSRFLSAAQWRNPLLYHHDVPANTAFLPFASPGRRRSRARQERKIPLKYCVNAA